MSACDDIAPLLRRHGYLDICSALTELAQDNLHMLDANAKQHHHFVGELFKRCGELISVRCDQLKIDQKAVPPLEPDFAELEAIEVKPLPPEDPVKELSFRVRRQSDNWPDQGAERRPVIFRLRPFDRGGIGLGNYHDYFIMTHTQAEEYHKALGELIEAQRAAVMSPHFVVINDTTQEIRDFDKRIVSFRFDKDMAVLFDASGSEVVRVPLTEYTIKAIQ